jgi:hypothetical protein
MTAPTSPMLCAGVVITATTNGIRITDTTNSYTAAVTPGTYYVTGTTTASGDLFKAISDALVAAGTATWIAEYSNTGKLEISANTTWSIDWDNSLTTIDTDLLGIADDSAAFGAAGEHIDTADYVPQGMWSPGAAPSTDDGHATLAEATESDVAQHRAQSGAVWTVRTGGPFETRLVTFEGLPHYKLYPTTGYENQDLKSLIADWLYCGQRARYYVDAATPATGYFDCVLDEETLRQYRPRRLAPGVALYGIDLGLRGYVA